MWTTSTRWGPSWRQHHVLWNTAKHLNLVTGKLTNLDIIGGSITDDATSTVRRVLNLNLPNKQSLWDMFSAPGEITVRQGIRYPDGSREDIPMGVFRVDQDQIEYGPGGTISLTAPDRTFKIQQNKFGLNRASVPGNSAHAEIQRLVEGAWPGGTYPFPGWAQLDTSASAKVGVVLWDDGDRMGAITDLATAHSLEFFFNREGLAVLRPVPTLSNLSVPVWTVDAGPEGVLMGADRTRDMSRTHNAVIVTTSASDITLAPQEVKNTTVGDPLSVTGPWGYMPTYYSSPIIRTTSQAHAAGLTILSRELGVAQQLSLTASRNPALDSEDIIKVVLPINDLGRQDVELHMIDTITHTLTLGEQSIATRSTRPDSDGS